jgi:hypothetical protein
MTPAKGRPATSRSLKSSLGDRISPRLRGTRTHQLYATIPSNPQKAPARIRRLDRILVVYSDGPTAGALDWVFSLRQARRAVLSECVGPL